MSTENPRVWFKSISLENVRSFGTKQTINFTDKDGNAARWNVILGDNGTGKTTVLKGLCLGENGAYVNAHWFERNGDGRVSISESDGSTTREIELSLKVNTHREGKWSEIKYISGFENINKYSFARPLVFAYGAARRISTTGITEEKNSHFESLFDENANLINAEEVLVQADYAALKDGGSSKNRYDQISQIVKQLFREEVSDVEIVAHALTRFGPPKVYFHTNYGKVLLHELNLGYKTLIAWMVDFAKGLLDRYPDSENPLDEPAVCLVDEIDLHLHPKFQRTIIKFLTDTFTNTQFIVTAHSPLIVQSAEDANIIVLKREGNQTVIEADRINVHDWRIDQILSSDMFGRIGGRAPDIEEKMTRRRALLRKDKTTEAEKMELEALEKELGNLPVSESREALKALDIIGQALINQ